MQATDIELIVRELWHSRNSRQRIKKKTMELRRKFLEERAERMAQKMRTTEEKALKAILKAEDSKRIYASIQNLTGKSNSLLT